MKRLLLVAILACLCQRAHANACNLASSSGISCIERQSWLQGGGATSGASCAGGVITFTFSTSTTSGELISLGTTDTGNALGTVSDSASQSYTTDNSKLSGMDGSYATGNFYKFNSASGVTSVTYTSHGGVCGAITATITHYTGIATSNAHDVSSGFNSSAQSSPWASPSATTTNSTDLLIGYCFGFFSSANVTIAATGSWVLDSNSGGTDFNGGTNCVEDQIVTSTGSYQATGTSNQNTTFAAISAFKAAGGGGPTVFPVDKRRKLEQLEESLP